MDKDKPKILVVEDEELNIKLFKMILQSQRYEVITAENGKKGVGTGQKETSFLM